MSQEQLTVLRYAFYWQRKQKKTLQVVSKANAN